MRLAAGGARRRLVSRSLLACYASIFAVCLSSPVLASSVLNFGCSFVADTDVVARGLPRFAGEGGPWAAVLDGAALVVGVGRRGDTTPRGLPRFAAGTVIGSDAALRGRSPAAGSALLLLVGVVGGAVASGAEDYAAAIPPASNVVGACVGVSLAW